MGEVHVLWGDPPQCFLPPRPQNQDHNTSHWEFNGSHSSSLSYCLLFYD